MNQTTNADFDLDKLQGVMYEYIAFRRQKQSVGLNGLTLFLQKT